MTQVADLIATDIEQYLHTHENKSLLRVIACGSVGDGKSTLIGRMLFEANILLKDQLAAVQADSRKYAMQGEEVDFALLVDGLAAEREQGITIDVGYQFFSTQKRKFIVADTPDDEQYTRNMVAGASTADVAVVMVDARKGALPQTRRLSYLLSMIGIRHVVVAINKMDLVNYDEVIYRRIVAEYREVAQKIGIDTPTFVPLSALSGDNVVVRSALLQWYEGPTLMDYLESVDLATERLEHAPFRFPVQWVNRPNLGFRGFSGMVVGGIVRLGDRLRIQPSGKESSVARIVSYDGDLEAASAGQSVTLVLSDEVDISRGDVISRSDSPAEVADQFEVGLVWLHEEPLFPGRPYLLKIGARTLTASVTEIKYQVNVNSLEHVAAKTLELNVIGVCNLSLDCPIAFDPYVANRDTGGFILIDRLTNDTVGAGMIHFALRRAHNIHIQHVDVDKHARATIKGQKPCLLWFTGLSGAGKSTIANLVEKKLHGMGRHTYLLDGDNVRHGLNKDLGFTDVDRVENIRRVAEVAKLMVDAGLIVLTAFISPFRAERQMARDLVEADEFIEIFVDAPLHIAELRDPKGLYKKARRGELKNFTGIDSPYEPPSVPELHLAVESGTAEEMAEQVISVLRERGVV